jgi:WD40 repeat protein
MGRRLKKNICLSGTKLDAASVTRCLSPALQYTCRYGVYHLDQSSASARRELPDWLSKGPKVEEKQSPELQTLESHSHWVWSVAFSQDGQLLASGSEDKTIKLWDPTTGALKHTLEGHSDPILSVAFSQDGQLLASGSDDETTSSGILPLAPSL